MTCALAGLLAALLLAGPAFAAGGSGVRTVLYHGLRLHVPAVWSVYRLDRDPAACVRFNRHAVYLGVPGSAQRCPAAGAAGRTEAILLEPRRAAAAATRAVLPAAVSARQVRFVEHGVLVTATWSRHPGELARLLGLHALPRPATAPHAARASVRGSGSGGASSSGSAPSGSSTAGAPYTGRGFDACSTPSSAQMSAWGSSPYRAIGVYIGGANMACSQRNLTAAWVTREASAGWHLVPIYVGLQAPHNSCGCAAIQPGSASSEGVAAAQDAVTQAQSVGLGSGNPIYFDMEAYSRGGSDTSAVLTFLQAWTSQLHAAGYLSGVYSSSDSGVADLSAQVGTTYQEPDDIWTANWNGQNNTADPNLASGDWANHQRLHQNRGAHNETYGGTTINIDGDYLDGATAGPAGGGTQAATPPPSLTIAPGTDGTINLLPKWDAGAEASWQILGGASAASMAAVGSPVSATSRPIVVHSDFAYFAVQALDSGGSVLGSSIPVATPAHLALFGSSAYVSPGGVGGIPVACSGGDPCALRTTISLRGQTLASTGTEHPGRGGLVYFSLTREGRWLLAHAHRRRMAVTVSMQDSSRLSLTRQINLVAFSTWGRGPARSVHQGPALRLVAGTDFVSSGWVGGILSGCSGASACQATMQISAFGRTVATTGSETLGAGELGYLMFTLTADGHRLLRAQPGNQLPATVTITSTAGGSTQVTSGQIALVAF